MTHRPETDAPTELTPTNSRVIWILLTAAFVAILNETTLGNAIPALKAHFGVEDATAQWVSSAFLLTMAVVIPTSGFLIRRFTTRQMFVAALTLFSAGTLVGVLAPTFPLLIAARVIQASGTALLMPLLMTTVMNVVPQHMRGRMMGRISMVIAMAPAIGPALSGFLVDHFGWRANFTVVLPIALAALALGLRYLTNVGEQIHEPIDVLSVVLSALGFGGVVYGISQIGSAHGGTDAANASGPTIMIVCIVVGVISLALFVWRQLQLQRKDDALLDMRIFAVKNFSVASVQFFILSMAFFGSITVLPIFLQSANGLSATEAGLTVLPGALLMGVLGPIIGRIYDAKGARILLVPGAIIATSVMWYFTTMTTDTPYVAILIAQISLSVGLALSFTPLFTASLGSLPRSLYSYGSAAVSTTQQVAGAVGVALLMAIMGAGASAFPDPHAAEAVASGAHSAFLVGAILASFTIIGAFLVKTPEADADAEPHAGH